MERDQNFQLSPSVIERIKKHDKKPKKQILEEDVEEELEYIISEPRLNRKKSSKIKSVGRMFLLIGWDIDINYELDDNEYYLVNGLVFLIFYFILDLFCYKLKNKTD